MAANTIEYLKHGKALCGKVFAAFVETFNWHTDFCKNLKGDADLPGKAGATGRITVDRTDPSNPIIRLESPYASNGEVPEEKPEPEEPEEPYVPPYDEPDEDPEDDDPYEGEDDDGPADDQDPWYENPEDSPADPEGGSGCNFWSDEPHFGEGTAGGGGWSGDNCNSVNDFNR